MTEEALKIGELARRAGVSRRTIDFYTGMGLLRPSGRTEGNYRLYEPEAVAQVRLIRRLEEQGLPLREIATALEGRRRRDIERALDAVDRDIHTLRAAVGHTPALGGAEATGALSALADRLRSLVEAALEITGGAAPPL